MALAEDLERQFRASLREWRKAEFVDEEQLDGSESRLLVTSSYDFRLPDGVGGAEG